MDLLFAHLNLRQNPFGEATAEDRASMAVVDADRWLDCVQDGQHALQFIGDSGRGKSTHLIALHHAMLERADPRSSTRLRITEGEKPPPWPASEVLFVDEIQAASRRHRAKLFRSGRPLILGTHEDLGHELRRFNYTVTTRHIHRTDAATLHTMFERRIAHVRRSGGPVPVIPKATVVALINRHGDNVRSMERELYSVFQELKEPGDVRL